MNRTITLVLIGFCSVVYAGPWEAIDGLQIGKISAQRLSGESTVLHPAASPDGKYIAYVDHWTSIWIADANGENAKKIVNVTDSLNVFANPRWSPDSNSLVYTAGIGHSRRGGKTTIWRFRMADEKRERLFQDHQFDAFDKTFLSWSPDGLQIATNGIVDGKDQLLVLDVSDSETSVATLEMETVGSISWSKDGKHILIQGDAHEKGNLWLVAVESYEKMPLDSGGVQGRQAEYSPDGKWISFQSEKDDSVFIIPVDGGVPVPILDPEWLGRTAVSWFHSQGVRWDANGKSLLSTVVPPNVSTRSMLGIIDTSGSNFQVLFDNDSSKTFDFRPEWSPDGERIAFSIASEKDTTIFSIDVSTGKTEKITNGKHPTWSPYMDEMAFARHGNIWVRNLETEVESQVTLNLGDAGTPQWSPVGDLIFLHDQGYLWLVSSLGGEPRLFGQRGGAFNWSADGTRGWAHNNESNDYNGIWGDTWEYSLEDAPNAGKTWGGSQGHVPYVAPDGSFVASFSFFEEGGIIVQKPNEKTGRLIFEEYDGLRPAWVTVSPSGTRIAFFLQEPWVREIWKIDISDIVADSVVP
ncbi:MAG: hypothetical protein HOK90_28640 [Gemmatimonadetes bacterium]|nr:hypothetical protein [Gemmatimonadota bacterium]